MKFSVGKYKVMDIWTKNSNFKYSLVGSDLVETQRGKSIYYTAQKLVVHDPAVVEALNVTQHKQILWSFPRLSPCACGKFALDWTH